MIKLLCKIFSFYWYAVIFLVIVLTLPSLVEARTIGEILNQACPATLEANRLIREAQAERAVGYKSAYFKYRQAALLFYRCNQDAHDSYARDWALYFYGNNFLGAARTNGEGEQYGLQVAVAMNDLAARTAYNDVRKAALDLRKFARAMSKEAHEAIYGTPEPAPTPDSEKSI